MASLKFIITFCDWQIDGPWMINIEQLKSGNLSWMSAVVGGRRRTERLPAGAQRRHGRKARHVRRVACGAIRRGRASLRPDSYRDSSGLFFGYFLWANKESNTWK
jgi:hypothetical protein